MTTRRRAALLAACVLGGIVICVAGWMFSGSQWWFAAIPACMAAGWLGVADPTRCVPSDGDGRSRRSGGNDPVDRVARETGAGPR